MKKRKLALCIILGVLSTFLVGGAITVPVVYHEVNYPKAPTIIDNKIHVACIGDSITYGYGVLFERNTKSYPVYLNQHLGNEYQVLNYGLCGRTLMKKGDKPYLDEELYTASIDAKADTYIIMLGTNDSKPNNWNISGNSDLTFKNDYIDLINSYKSLNNHPTIIVVKPPKAFKQENKDLSVFDIDGAVIENNICPIIDEIGEELMIKVIDLQNLTKDHPEWFTDGVHSNALGNSFIAEEIFKNL